MNGMKMRKLLGCLLAFVTAMSLAACDKSTTSSSPSQTDASAVTTESTPQKNPDTNKPTDSTVISRMATADGQPYVEYLGEPYLMYGVQMRLDWIFKDTNADTAFIEENFAKVKELGFNSVMIPIYWQTIEPEMDNYDFTQLKLYYTYLNKYDLTVQWLWFGTNVCGVGYIPEYVSKDRDTYKIVTADNGAQGNYMDFSCAATMKREQKALSEMMEWIARNDQDKRCVMIQLNNEVDQGAGYFQENFTDETIVGGWWQSQEAHDKYCWVGGQRTAVFAQLSALGNIVHKSSYPVVTRVNVSGAGRDEVPELVQDYRDMLMMSGIDMVGVDSYDEALRGFPVIFGNFRGESMSRYRERCGGNTSGGICSNWGATLPVYLQRNMIWFSMAYNDMLYWNAEYDDMNAEEFERCADRCFEKLYAYCHSPVFRRQARLIEIVHTTDKPSVYHSFVDGVFTSGEQYRSDYFLGQYRIVYEDESTEEIPVFLGENIGNGSIEWYSGAAKSESSSDNPGSRAVRVDCRLCEVAGSTLPFRLKGKVFYKCCVQDRHPEKTIRDIRFIPWEGSGSCVEIQSISVKEGERVTDEYCVSDVAACQV